MRVLSLFIRHLIILKNTLIIEIFPTQYGNVELEVI